MVQDDVQDHFNTGAVKCLHHLPEFRGLTPLRSIEAVGLFGRKVGDRIIAPVVLEFFSRHRIEQLRLILVELENRHQLNGGHSQVLEIRYFFGQAGEGSGMLRLRTHMNCEAANVCLVDDRIRG